jgi:hypothetical protein
MEGIFIPLSFFASIVLIVYIYYTNRNKERMALIEKGLDASIFRSPKSTGLLTIKFAFLFIGIGIGILVGNILETTTRLNEEVAYFSMIFLFGGASLIIFHLLEKKFAKTEKEE